MHIHIPGLFGLITPRTKLSPGFGYKINMIDSYSINLIKKTNELNTLTNEFTCSILKINELDDNDNGIRLEANIYKFGVNKAKSKIIK
jgi:hypothetical protein